METLAFEIGNTQFHFGWIDNGLLSTCSFPHALAGKRIHSSSAQLHDDLAKFIGQHLPAQAPMQWLGTSVHQVAVQTLKEVTQSLGFASSFRLLQRNDIPIKKNLQNQQTVGVDRLLAAWQAYQITGRATIIVDAGSAVTVDWVCSEGIFQGGMIFPGLRLAARSLSDHTDALPEVTLEDPLATIQQVYGRDTNSAIQCGLLWSQWGGICHAVRRLQQLHSVEKDVTVTGGGLSPFLSLLPPGWNHQPHLNIKGLLDLANPNPSPKKQPPSDPKLGNTSWGDQP